MHFARERERERERETRVGKHIWFSGETVICSGGRNFLYVKFELSLCLFDGCQIFNKEKSRGRDARERERGLQKSLIHNHSVSPV